MSTRTPAPVVIRCVHQQVLQLLRCVLARAPIQQQQDNDSFILGALVCSTQYTICMLNVQSSKMHVNQHQTAQGRSNDLKRVAVLTPVHRLLHKILAYP